jgi:CDP-glucose 4,6-dehydratase
MFNQLVEVYKGKKVFLTGHTGFKGSWLVKIFNLLGADVKGYALAPEGNLTCIVLLMAMLSASRL